MAFLYRLQPPRPSFPTDMTPDEAEVMGAHAGYWQELLDRDVAIAFGPVLDPKDPWGLALIGTDDEQEARAIADSDPAVSSGTCTYSIVPVQLAQRS